MIRDKWQIDDEYRKRCIGNIVGKMGALRAAMDMSQDELASLICVSRSTLNAMETGRREMSWTVYLAITAVFFANDQTRAVLKEFNLYPKEFVQRIADNSEL